ncbi:dephospho-CoA kinase [Candidatus Peregrinibacteria bacterium]|nr:dephospho-CoA kinase [Candidatus Peregrinibacteria bacterium]
MVIGICGKIASGKSEVLKIFGRYGFFCIDADKIVHDLYKPGGLGAVRVAAYFGKRFLKKNGEVDRIKLRNAVFSNENKLKLLQDIIHPTVYNEISLLLQRHKDEDVAIESVFFDKDFLGDFVDQLIWVERDEKEILKVLKEERGFDDALARKAIDLVQKPEKGDIFELKNCGGLDLLEAYVVLMQ